MYNPLFLQYEIHFQHSPHKINQLTIIYFYCFTQDSHSLVLPISEAPFVIYLYILLLANWCKKHMPKRSIIVCIYQCINIHILREFSLLIRGSEKLMVTKQTYYQ